jgi:hypothetical protein
VLTPAFIEVYVKRVVMKYVKMEGAMKNVQKNLKSVNINVLEFVEKGAPRNVKNVI